VISTIPAEVLNFPDLAILMTHTDSSPKEEVKSSDQSKLLKNIKNIEFLK